MSRDNRDNTASLSIAQRRASFEGVQPGAASSSGTAAEAAELIRVSGNSASKKIAQLNALYQAAGALVMSRKKRAVASGIAQASAAAASSSSSSSSSSSDTTVPQEAGWLNAIAIFMGKMHCDEEVKALIQNELVSVLKKTDPNSSNYALLQQTTPSSEAGIAVIEGYIDIALKSIQRQSREEAAAYSNSQNAASAAASSSSYAASGGMSVAQQGWQAHLRKVLGGDDQEIQKFQTKMDQRYGLLWAGDLDGFLKQESERLQHDENFQQKLSKYKGLKQLSAHDLEALRIECMKGDLDAESLASKKAEAIALQRRHSQQNAASAAAAGPSSYAASGGSGSMEEQRWQDYLSTFFEASQRELRQKHEKDADYIIALDLARDQAIGQFKEEMNARYSLLKTGDLDGFLGQEKARLQRSGIIGDRCLQALSQYEKLRDLQGEELGSHVIGFMRRDLDTKFSSSSREEVAVNSQRRASRDVLQWSQQHIVQQGQNSGNRGK